MKDNIGFIIEAGTVFGKFVSCACFYYMILNL